jgi:exodeoxyribonuclease VII small subunit
MAARKTKTESDSNSPGPSFEDALAGLEHVVEAMEHGQLPLEELVDHYERGSALLKHCESILQSARGRIELITLRNQSTAADSAEITGTTPPASGDCGAESDDDDDIRLF